MEDLSAIPPPGVDPNVWAVCLLIFGIVCAFFKWGLREVVKLRVPEAPPAAAHQKLQDSMSRIEKSVSQILEIDRKLLIWHEPVQVDNTLVFEWKTNARAPGEIISRIEALTEEVRRLSNAVGG